jgi:hypothetical protein
MKMELIQKPNYDNVLSRQEKLQPMSTIQILWFMFTDERNLWCKLKEWYIEYPKTQNILSEFCKGMALKEVKFVNILLKYKQKLGVCVCDQDSPHPWVRHSPGGGSSSLNH